VSALLLVLALQAPPAGAVPGRILQQGTLVVRHDTVEVAREHYRLVAGRAAPTGPGTGWTLTSTIRYDRQRPVVTLAPTLEIAPDTAPAALQYDVADPREPVRILGQLGGGRFTVRVLARQSERAREFAALGATLVLDDSVFAPYLVAAWRAGPEPTRVTAIYPRALRRETLTLEDHGRGSADSGRRHVTLTGGTAGPVHLWLDGAGRLVKVEIPSRRVVAERSPEG